MSLTGWDLNALTHDPGVVRVVKRETDRIAREARASAPEDTEAYKNGITTRIKYQKRAVGVVEATDPKSLIVEAKTGNLARAVKKAARNKR